MAKLIGTPRRGSVLFIEKMTAASFNRDTGFSFKDADGAEFFISNDVIAHLISIADLELNGQHSKVSADYLSDQLCSCGPK